MTRRQIEIVSAVIVALVLAYGLARGGIVDDSNPILGDRMVPVSQSEPAIVGRLMDAGMTRGIVEHRADGTSFGMSWSDPLTVSGPCDKSECQKNAAAQCSAAGKGDSCKSGTIKTVTNADGSKWCSCRCDNGTCSGTACALSWLSCS